MGTSAARRPPATALWRAARGAARRYFAPEGEPAVAVQEVVGHYLAALAEEAPEGRGLKESLPLSRKAAQNLGAFWAQAATQGSAAALETWGLAAFCEAPAPVLAAGLAAAWIGPEGGLEAAAARTALQSLLPKLWPTTTPSETTSAESTPALPSPCRVASRFLAAALYQSLALDLGESLEAAAPDGKRLQDALDGLRSCLEQAGAATGAADTELPPELWRGLEGWLLVERLWDDLLKAVDSGYG